MDSVVGLVGAVMALIGAVWIIGHAFGKGCLIGLACLLIPLVTPIYALIHIRELWKPLVLWVVGLLLVAPAARHVRATNPTAAVPSYSVPSAKT